MILSKTTPTCSLLFFEMTIFRNSILSGTEFYCLWRKSRMMTSFWRIVQIKNTRVWEIKDRIGIVRPGDSSEEVRDLILTDWKLWWREVSSKKFEIRTLKPEAEILRRTPWSKVREQNSVYKEFLEIVGSGKPTGNVWKEIAVSAAIWISVGKVHHQIRLRILSCRQNERKPSRTRSPRGESPSGRMSRWPCKDYHQRNLQ